MPGLAIRTMPSFIFGGGNNIEAKNMPHSIAYERDPYKFNRSGLIWQPSHSAYLLEKVCNAPFWNVSRP